jgi:hypothetical protein
MSDNPGVSSPGPATDKGSSLAFIFMGLTGTDNQTIYICWRQRMSVFVCDDVNAVRLDRLFFTTEVSNYNHGYNGDMELSKKKDGKIALSLWTNWF